ncbi:KTSC domain-containing protein [Rhizobium beringeri]|nr:KTSC domain-containing protein [Rhizobium beringeri]WSH14737.1 KTSC domain-containing protein [Rhizobium beringeri]
MERQPVTSDNLAEVGHDPDLEILEIMFRNGNVYQYYDFPAFMFERLMNSDSLGKFFNIEIKKHYREARM